MSHSIPRRIAERRELLVRRRDLLALAPYVVGVEPRHDPHVPRVVADREVLVAARERRLAHLEHRRLPVRPGRVDVQVAADLPELDERRRSPRNGSSRSSGGQNGIPSAR